MSDVRASYGYEKPETVDTNRLETIIRNKIQVYKDEIKSNYKFYNWLKKTGSDRADWYLNRLDKERFTEGELASRIVSETLDRDSHNGLGSSTRLRQHFRDGLIEFFNISQHDILVARNEMERATIRGMSGAANGFQAVNAELLLISAQEFLIKAAYQNYKSPELVEASKLSKKQ